MSDINESNMVFSTIPAYDQIKEKIVNQMAIAENLVSEYVIRPSYVRAMKGRRAITKLAIAVSDYIYIIEDDDAKKLFCAYMSNPEMFEKSEDLVAILSVCKKIIYEIGISQIETSKLSPWEVYKDVD